MSGALGRSTRTGERFVVRFRLFCAPPVLGGLGQPVWGSCAPPPPKGVGWVPVP